MITVGDAGTGADRDVTAEDDVTDAIFKFLSKVLNILYEVWGYEKGTGHLWKGANIILLEWLYLNTVIAPYHQGKGGKTTQLTEEQFKLGVLQMKIEGSAYHKATKGYPLNDAQRAYLYGVLWVIFKFAFYINGEEKITLPKPAWAHGYEKQLREKIKSFESTQLLQRQKPVKEKATQEELALPRPPAVIAQGVVKRRTAAEVADRVTPGEKVSTDAFAEAFNKARRV